MQKSIRDQIIEGSLDGDITKNLLKQPHLTLDAAITLCRAQQAAKKQRGKMNSANPGAVLAIKQRQLPPTIQPATCPGCGSKPHRGGQVRCPAYEQIYHHCNKVRHFARVCRAKKYALPRPLPPVAAKTLQIAWTDEQQQCRIDTITHIAASEPAPTIKVHICSARYVSPFQTQVLTFLQPDHSFYSYLRNAPSIYYHQRSFPEQQTAAACSPWAKYLSHFTYKEGSTRTWKAARSLSILPSQYSPPTPIFAPSTTCTSNINAVSATPNKAVDAIISKFPTVFDD